jgi:PKD repeat protein
MNLKVIVFLIPILLFASLYTNGQSVQLTKVSADQKSPLNKVFFEYKLLKIEYSQLKSAMSSRGNQHWIHLTGPEMDWNLEMYEHDIHSPRFVSRVATDNGIITTSKKPANTPMIGYLRSTRGGNAKLVVADNYIAGMVEQGGAKYFIEPANGIDPALSPNVLVIYNSDHIIQNTEIQCGFDLYKHNQRIFEEQGGEQKITERNHCVQVEIAISNDFTVFQKRGSQAAVENWNTTILTLMQDNWDNEFQHGIEFVQSASFVAVSAGSDPWNGINVIDVQLDQHRSWGQGGGYGQVFDVATNWSTKYKTGAVGLAWLGVVCTSLKYNVCSDYGGSNGCIKQLMAHELGHNFNANHDAGGSPFIMAPAVNCTNAWSNTSISSINGHVNSRGCLGICAGGNAPQADFFGNPTEACVPFVVQFTDLSTNDPTSWQWTFPGGTPSSSTLKNPSVQYKAYGMYDVTLKATNTYGSNTVTFKQYIFAKEKPKANFSKVIIGRSAYFTNLSLYSSNVEWNFGDGETSNDENPFHEYADDGVYTVTLLAENECGLHEMKMTVTIVTIPIALFDADTTKGCASFKVKFKNLSSKNVTSWEWVFPGGTPSTSSQFEPTVEYKKPGVFDVKLSAINSKYKATAEKLMFITVDSIPVPAFDTTINVDVVNFTDKSKYAKSWHWDFGDGKSSTVQNPSHKYAPGIYDVTLTVKNPCDSQKIKKQIIIGKALIAGFKSDTAKGCIPFEVKYTNTSHGASSYQWTFPGGNPSSSQEKDPVVSYEKPGVYDVRLMAFDATDTSVIVQTKFIEAIASPEASYTSTVAGYSVYFTNQSKHATTYLWSFGDGKTSTDESPVHVYVSENEYIVTLITSNECGNDTFIKQIAVYLVPKVNFLADTTLICGKGAIQFTSKTSSDVKDWSWQFEGGEPSASNDTNPIVFYDKKGTYNVKLTVKNTNGENELTKQAFIKVMSAVLCPENTYTKTDEPGEVLTNPIRRQTRNLQIYPNPVRDVLFIQGSTQSERVQLKMIDIFGKVVLIENIDSLNGAFSHEVILETFNSGTYLVNLKSATETITKTIFLTK